MNRAVLFLGVVLFSSGLAFAAPVPVDSTPPNPAPFAYADFTWLNAPLLIKL